MNPIESGTPSAPSVATSPTANVRLPIVLQRPLRCAQVRAAAIKSLLGESSRVKEMTEAELCRIYGRVTRNPFPQRNMPLAEVVAKAQYRSRSRRA